MKLSYLMTLPLSLFLMSQSSLVYATDTGKCKSTAADLQEGQTTISGTMLDLHHNNQWSITPAAHELISAFTLINCESFISGNNVTAKTSSYSMAGSNLNFMDHIDYGGQRYYKIINTNNILINRHAYITFRIEDTRTKWENRKNIEPEVVFWTDEPNHPATQGVHVHSLKLLFNDRIIQEQTVSNIKIGTIKIRAVRTDVTPTIDVSDSQGMYINLVIKPVETRTCSLGNHTITLPTISTSVLRSVGYEAGRTNFAITALCDRRLANMTITAVIGDNNKITSQTNTLVNKGTAKDVAIKLYHANDSTPANFDTDFTFGTLVLNGSSDATTFTRNFYATYAATGPNVTAGTVDSMATISVFYK